MKLVVVKIIFEVLLVPNKGVFRIQVNYVIPIGFAYLGRKSASNLRAPPNRAVGLQRSGAYHV